MANSFLNRLFGRRRERAAEHEAEKEHMSPSERHFVEESTDDRQAKLESEAHLGGGASARPSDDAPPSD